MSAPPPPPPASSTADKPGTAKFKTGKAELACDFNPASLKISLTNQFGEDPPQQHAKPTTTKLDVEVIFDTTEDGADVRGRTDKLRAMATATGAEATKKKGGGGKKDEANHSLDMVTFTWGTASYTGIIESLTETLDYWSSDGVPLRATVQLSMKGAADKFFSGAGKAAGYAGDKAVPSLDEYVVAATPDKGAGVTAVAAQGGDTGTGRGLAAANGVENMRDPGGGAGLSAGAGVSLSAAAGFAMSGGISAGASIGFGIGASAGASIGAGLDASVGVGMSAGAGFGASASFGASAGATFGASASAGFGASASAGFGGSASAGFGATAGAGFGASAGFGATASSGAMFGVSASAGFGGSIGLSGGGAGIAMTSSTSVTGFDGIKTTQTNSTFITASGTSSFTTRSASAGVSASQGAFAGLGMSKTRLPSASFNPMRLLPPPMPSAGPGAQFDSTGRLVSSGGQVAASYSARASVTIF